MRINVFLLLLSSVCVPPYTYSLLSPPLPASTGLGIDLRRIDKLA